MINDPSLPHSEGSAGGYGKTFIRILDSDPTQDCTSAIWKVPGMPDLIDREIHRRSTDGALHFDRLVQLRVGRRRLAHIRPSI